MSDHAGWILVADDVRRTRAARGLSAFDAALVAQRADAIVTPGDDLSAQPRHVAELFAGV